MLRKSRRDPRYHSATRGDQVAHVEGKGYVWGALEWWGFVHDLAQAVRDCVEVNRKVASEATRRAVPEEVCANMAFGCISGGNGSESGPKSSRGVHMDLPHGIWDAQV